MKKQLILIFTITFLLSSCGGIKWTTKTSARLGASLPPEITDYVYLKGDFTSSVDPRLVVGTLLIKVNDSTFIQTERQYFKNDTLIVLVEYAEDPIYSSKITQGFEANGKYSIAEINADGETAFELTIDRFKFAELKSDNIDTAKLFNLYRNISKNNKPKVSSTKSSNVKMDEDYLNNPYNYQYIKGVQVNSIITKVYAKTDVSAKVDGGTSAFGAGANVYKSTEGYVKYYTTGVKLVSLPLLLLEYGYNNIEILKKDSTKFKVDQIDIKKGFKLE